MTCFDHTTLDGGALRRAPLRLLDLESLCSKLAISSATLLLIDHRFRTYLIGRGIFDWVTLNTACRLGFDSNTVVILTTVLNGMSCDKTQNCHWLKNRYRRLFHLSNILYQVENRPGKYWFSKVSRSQER